MPLSSHVTGGRRPAARYVKSQPGKAARSIRANRPSPSARYGLQTQRPDPHPTSQGHQPPLWWSQWCLKVIAGLTVGVGQRPIPPCLRGVGLGVLASECRSRAGLGFANSRQSTQSHTSEACGPYRRGPRWDPGHLRRRARARSGHSSRFGVETSIECPCRPASATFVWGHPLNDPRFQRASKCVKSGSTG